MASKNVNLATALASIDALRETVRASNDQGALILSEVREVKSRVGDQAVAIGSLQTRMEQVQKDINGLGEQNRLQEERLREVEQRPEKPKAVEDELRRLEHAMTGMKDEFVTSMSKMAEQMASSKTFQYILGAAINVVAAGSVAGLIEYLAHRAH